MQAIFTLFPRRGNVRELQLSLEVECPASGSLSQARGTPSRPVWCAWPNAVRRAIPNATPASGERLKLTSNIVPPPSRWVSWGPLLLLCLCSTDCSTDASTHLNVLETDIRTPSHDKTMGCWGAGVQRDASKDPRGRTVLRRDVAWTLDQEEPWRIFRVVSIMQGTKEPRNQGQALPRPLSTCCTSTGMYHHLSEASSAAAPGRRCVLSHADTLGTKVWVWVVDTALVSTPMACTLRRSTIPARCQAQDEEAHFRAGIDAYGPILKPSDIPSSSRHYPKVRPRGM